MLLGDENERLDRLCMTINHLSRYTVMSITQRKWIRDIFN